MGNLNILTVTNRAKILERADGKKTHFWAPNATASFTGGVIETSPELSVIPNVTISAGEFLKEFKIDRPEVNSTIKISGGQFK